MNLGDELDELDEHEVNDGTIVNNKTRKIRYGIVKANATDANDQPRGEVRLG